MKSFLRHASAVPVFASAAIAVGLFAGWSASMAQAPAKAAPPKVHTSINALMVALVDDSAQVIWDAAYSKTLSDDDWQKVGGNAVKLNAAGTLIALGGMGKSDAMWVSEPAWQEWSQKLTASAILAESAVKIKDRAALLEAGNIVLSACEGCHTAFKTAIPTGGFFHIPVGNELNGRRN